MVNGKKLNAQDVFALISEHLPTYEQRDEQIRLSQLIDRVLSEGGEGQANCGVFEAGTGIGKSLAALVPAILSGKKVVVSTATIALQEQYVSKDLPFLSSVLPVEFSFALMKGRGNYLGLRRFHDFLLEQEAYDSLVDWANSTTFGDISELNFVPPQEIWAEINSDSDDCLRQKCPNFKDCFYFKARSLAETADVLVVNHALLLADAASEGAILPSYDLLIVDEAHHLPNIAEDTFGSFISNRGLKSLLNKAGGKVNAPQNILQVIETESNYFFSSLDEKLKYQRMRLKESIDGAKELHFSLTVLRDWLSSQEFGELDDEDLIREKAKLRAKALHTTTLAYLNCLELLEAQPDSYVLWAERADFNNPRLAINASPLDVAPFIRETLLQKENLQAIVWMSATLATQGHDPFQYFKSRVGIEGRIVQDIMHSPFDYKKQAVLYLPMNIPEPNSRDYLPRAVEEIENLVHLAMGRTFVLFTSYGAMNAAFNVLSTKLPFECKRQGEIPRKRLLDWFISTPSAVLFATASFWEGVSVEGDQLSCVIIDRIPFQVPDDPVYEARREALEKENRSWFSDLALPSAITRLKQGVGRLIRTQRDRGIVAILDSRLTKKQYGSAILSCLPPMPVIRDLRGADCLEDLLEIAR